MRRQKVDALRVFAPPQNDLTYVLGGDLAEGLEHGDDSVLQVLCCQTGHQVAEYYLPTATPPEVGEEAMKLGLWYNTAYIGLENNKDLTPLHALHQTYHYPNLHYQQSFSAKPIATHTHKLGWNTNGLTRYAMVADGVDWLAQGMVTIHSPWLLDQMEIFAQNARGKYEAIAGGHDDLVMAWLIAVQLLKVQLTRTQDEREGLAPLWNGQPLDTPDLDAEGQPLTREARVAAKLADAHRDEAEASTMGNLL